MTDQTPPVQSQSKQGEEIVLLALRSAEFYAYCKLNWGPCEGCDPGAEGEEIAGEVIHNIWAAFDVLGHKPKYRERLAAKSGEGRA